MIQYIIAAGIGLWLGSQSKKSKKSYAHGGEVDYDEIIQSISEIRYDKLPPIKERTMSDKAYNKILNNATKDAIRTLYTIYNVDIYDLQKATKQKGGSYYKAFVDLYGENLKYAHGGEVSSVVNNLQKGDLLKIKFGSIASRDNEVSLKVRSRNKIRNGRIDKITFENVNNPDGARFYAYERGNGVFSFAMGDLAISNIEIVSDYAKGGEIAQKIDYSKRTTKDFKLGELVYDTRNKRYGTIIGIYDEYNSDKYEVRLDSDGMQPTEYLRKLGEQGDKGTKKQLFEGVSSIERLITTYPENNYPKLINNPFYAKGGMTEHGLEIGDKIISEKDNSVLVWGQDEKGKIKKNASIVNLDKGTRKNFAKGGKMQGYDDRLDESLSMRDGAGRKKQQSKKDRRDESAGMEKSMGRRKYASVGTMDKVKTLPKPAKDFIAYVTDMAGDTTFKYSKTFQGANRMMQNMLKKNQDVSTHGVSKYDPFYGTWIGKMFFEPIKGFAKGGKMQGYNARGDEELGMTDGKESRFQQSKKDRRDEMKGENRSAGNKTYGSFAKGGEVSKYKTGITKYGKNQYAVRVDIGDKELIPKLLNDRWDSKEEAEAFAKRLAKRNNGTYVGEDGLFAKGGETDFIQQVVNSPDFRKGAFTKKAKERGLTPEEFMSKVLKNPDKYDERTRKQAQFMKNITD